MLEAVYSSTKVVFGKMQSAQWGYKGQILFGDSNGEFILALNI
jgi:hypothetical protein